MIRAAGRVAAILVLACITLCLATCISAQQRDFIKYDPAKDEFQLLSIMQNIHVQDQDDLEYLEAIYKNRDHLITPIVPGGGPITPLLASSIIRISGSQLLGLSIYGKRPTKLEPVNSPIPLNSIKITPGTFFLQNNKLGFYQAITIPGKTVDAALEAWSLSLQGGDTAKFIQDEIDRRADGGKVVAWDQLKAKTIKSIALEAPPAPATAPATQAAADAPINPLMVLDLQSLRNLKQALSGKTLRLRRDKQRVLLLLPLSASDSAQALDLFNQASARVGEIILANKNLPNKETKTNETLSFFELGQAIGRALTVSADDKGLHLSLDLLESTRAIDSIVSSHPESNDAGPDTAAGRAPPPDPSEYLRQHKIPIDPTLTAGQIIKDFNAGTLKGHPSAHPVKPGEGIVAPEKP